MLAYIPNKILVKNEKNIKPSHEISNVYPVLSKNFSVHSKIWYQPGNLTLAKLLPPLYLKCCCLNLHL